MKRAAIESKIPQKKEKTGTSLGEKFKQVKL